MVDIIIFMEHYDI